MYAFLSPEYIEVVSIAPSLPTTYTPHTPLHSISVTTTSYCVALNVSQNFAKNAWLDGSLRRRTFQDARECCQHRPPFCKGYSSSALRSLGILRLQRSARSTQHATRNVSHWLLAAAEFWLAVVCLAGLEFWYSNRPQRIIILAVSLRQPHTLRYVLLRNRRLTTHSTTTTSSSISPHHHHHHHHNHDYH